MSIKPDIRKRLEKVLSSGVKLPLSEHGHMARVSVLLRIYDDIKMFLLIIELTAQKDREAADIEGVVEAAEQLQDRVSTYLNTKEA